MKETIDYNGWIKLSVASTWVTLTYNRLNVTLKYKSYSVNTKQNVTSRYSTFNFPYMQRTFKKVIFKVAQCKLMQKLLAQLNKYENGALRNF